MSETQTTADTGESSGDYVDGLLKQYHSNVIQGLLGPIRDIYGVEGETNPELVAQAASVSEIMINGPSEIYFERGGELQRLMKTAPDGTVLKGADGKDLTASFESNDDLRALARAILQFSKKRLEPDDLSIEARTPDMHRVHIVQNPAARPGLSIAIRKFPKERVTMDDLIGFDSFTPQVMEYFEFAMAQNANILVSGGTGSGKTTLLNGLSELISPNDRILIIEDTSELRFDDDKHILQLEAQKPDGAGKGGIDIRELLRASLRMRPDRVIVGECRGGEALDMVQAMNTGHPGSMSTIHANSPTDCLSRLETLCLMAGLNIPLIALQRQIASAVQVIVQIGRHKVAGQPNKRRVVEIAEVRRFDHAVGFYVVKPIFTLMPQDGAPQGLNLRWSGEVPKLSESDAKNSEVLVSKW